MNTTIPAPAATRHPTHPAGARPVSAGPLRTRRVSARVQLSPIRASGAILVLSVGAALVIAGESVAAPTARPVMRGPLPGPLSVVTAFDPPVPRWTPGHRGVDLAATPLSAVRAPGDGTVVFAGLVAGRPVLSLDHGGGLRTTYEPVRPSVRAGDRVTAGQPVATLLAGHPGCPVEACLHWGARVTSGGPSGDDDDYVDPLGLVALHDRPVRLKPLRPGDGGG